MEKLFHDSDSRISTEIPEMHASCRDNAPSSSDCTSVLPRQTMLPRGPIFSNFNLELIP